MLKQKTENCAYLDNSEYSNIQIIQIIQTTPITPTTLTTQNAIRSQRDSAGRWRQVV